MQWGKANRDNRLAVDLEQLMQMARFDCEGTVYKFCGRVNRRKFGVPMGGFMSPGLAVIALSMVEANMEPGPDLTSGGWFATWMMCLACMLCTRPLRKSR